MALEIPEINREINVAKSEYTSPITNDKYTQGAFTAKCATQLIAVPHKNYYGALSLLPEGYRMSDLDEIEYLIQRGAELKGKNKSPREALKDALFERQIKGEPYLWAHSHVVLRAPKGKAFRDYIEKREEKKYTRGDYIIGEKIIAEGLLLPVSQGEKIVEWNRTLRIPAVVSEGNEPQHTVHWYIDTDESEVVVRLGGFWYGGGHDRCLRLVAHCGRSFSDSLASFRLFQGSLDDAMLPNTEYYVKDIESYEKGISEGRKKERADIAKELSAFLDKTKA